MINTKTISFYEIMFCMFGNASTTNLGLEELTLHKMEIHIIVSSSVTKDVFFPSLLFLSSPTEAGLADCLAELRLGSLFAAPSELILLLGVVVLPGHI